MYAYMNALILRGVCIHPPQHWHSSSSESYAKRPHKPAVDTELEGHVEHAAGPAESLYLLASHAVHVPPLAVYPVLHSQSSRASLAAFTCAQMRTHVHKCRNTRVRKSKSMCVCVCACTNYIYKNYIYMYMGSGFRV